MKYYDGQEISLGDRVRIGTNGGEGTVVCIIDTGEFTNEYPAGDWSYLEKGVLVDTEMFGLIYYEEPDFELQMLHRADIG